MNDARTPAEERLLGSVRAALQRKRAAAEEEWQDESTFVARIGRVAAAYHETLYHSVLGAAGVDEHELAERHAVERNSALRYLAERKQHAQERAAEVQARHQSDIAERTRRLQQLGGAQLPQPPVVALLTSATAIDVDANGGSDSIAPEANIARARAERSGWVSALQFDLRADLAVVDWHFHWTPPRTGLLNVVSALSMNGWAAAYPGPGCVRGSSSWTVDATLAVSQPDLSGQSQTDFVHTRIAQGDFGRADVPSYGGVILSATRLDEIRALTYQNQFVAVPQEPLLVTITVLLYVIVAHGEAEIDFMNGAFQLNVPFVYLFLT